jgi:hypothetical protein
VAVLSWSPDGGWLGLAAESGGVVLIRLEDGRMFPIPQYPVAVLGLAWSADSRHLATSGAFRIIAWDITTFSNARARPEATETGHAGLVPVDMVAMHPIRPLVAASYGNGMVVVARIGKRDELAVKAPGQAAVQAMLWSRDGRHLALGSKDGEAAIVTFPPHIFK